MLLTISTNVKPATDLGFLLHKNPSRAQDFELPFGRAHVFYPEATADRCTVALLLEVDPVGLVRNRRGPPGEGGALEQYVNDRPYVASSFVSVALARIFNSAMGGRSKDRPELALTEIPLEASLPAVPSRGGADAARRLFEPLGYEVFAPGSGPLGSSAHPWQSTSLPYARWDLRREHTRPLPPRARHASRGGILRRARGALHFCAPRAWASAATQRQ